MDRHKILQAYRELITLIRRLPKEQINQRLEEARVTIRRHREETDVVKQSGLVKQLFAKISFLRTVTPKVHGEQSRIGFGRYVLRDGKLVEGSGTTAGSRAADGTISMEEARQRHSQLLKRQNFGRDPPRYNPSSF